MQTEDGKGRGGRFYCMHYLKSASFLKRLLYLQGSDIFIDIFIIFT